MTFLVISYENEHVDGYKLDGRSLKYHNLEIR